VFDFTNLLRDFALALLTRDAYEREREKCCTAKVIPLRTCIDSKTAYYWETDVSEVFRRLKPSNSVRVLLSHLPFFDGGNPTTAAPRRTVVFTAVHLRWLEGSCLKRVSSNGYAQEADDICHMRVAFVTKWRESIGLQFAPLVIVGDDELPGDLRNLLDRGALHVRKSQTSSILSLGVDFWLLVYASETLGNFVSTFSTNACLIRRLLDSSECTFHVATTAGSAMFNRKTPLNETEVGIRF